MASVHDAFGLDEHYVTLFICYGFVLYSFGDHEQFTFVQDDSRVRQLDFEPTAQADRQFIRMIMLMPHKPA